jgi:2'-5' RNA ligase
MAFIGIRVPYESARLIHEIEVPGNKTDSNQLHITLFYLGSGINIKHISKAMMATYDIAQTIIPFLVKVNCVNQFDTLVNDKYPIIAPIGCQKLFDVREQMRKIFDKKKIDYDKRFKEYKPHITLSFSEQAVERHKIPCPIEFSVQELVLYGGQDGDEKIFITFPLDGKVKEK